MHYHIVQFQLRPSLCKGVSQIMPVGWVVQASAVLGAVFKAKPHGLTLKGWEDHPVCA